MLKKLIMTAGMAALLATPVMAAEEAKEASCAALLQQVEKAVQEVKLDDAARAKVDEMKARAEEQLKAGDEEGCKATASKILEALKG